jgi:acyl-CoA dehydrogenase
MIARANSRHIDRWPLSKQGVIADWIARSRIEIDAGRMLVLDAADKIDRGNAKLAMAEIAMSKIHVPNVALAVLDRAIQTHGGGGICQDFPLARIWCYLRTTRIADGPDEAHVAQLARLESKKSAEL